MSYICTNASPRVIVSVDKRCAHELPSMSCAYRCFLDSERFGFGLKGSVAAAGATRDMARFTVFVL